MSNVFGPSAGQPYYSVLSDDLPASQQRLFSNSEPVQSHYFNGKTVNWHYGAETRPNTPAASIISNAMDDGDDNTAQSSGSETHHFLLVPLTFPAIASVPDVENQDYHYENKYHVPYTDDINQIPELHLTDFGTETPDTIDILSNNLRSLRL